MEILLIGFIVLMIVLFSRNINVYSVRTSVLMKLGVDSHDKLPTYLQMWYNLRYWDKWTTNQWVKWLEKKGN